MILAHLWFNASLLLQQGKPRRGQKAALCLQKMAIEDVALRNLSILRSVSSLYMPMSLALSASLAECIWAKKKQNGVNHCRIFAC